MNKKLIAVAVAAGLATPMAANAAPTLYGQLQVEVSSIDNGGYGTGRGDQILDDVLDGTIENTGNQALRLNYNGIRAGQDGIIVEDNKRGRLGIKGDEDLGGGLSAIYQFEWQVETTQGEIRDGTRESYVGLKGGWGTLQLGSLKQPYKYTGGVTYDPFVATTLEARSNGGMSGRDTDLNYSQGAFGHHGFMQDALSYQNDFGIAKLWVAYSPDQAGGNKGRDGDINASLKFGDKDWEVFVAYANDDTETTGQLVEGTADSVDGYDATKVGGKYKLGSHTFKLQYEMTAAGTGTGNPDLETDILFLGYELGFGKNVLVAQYGMGDLDAGGDAGESTYFAVGLIHKFSKQTRAFVGYRDTSYDLPSGASVTIQNTGETVSSLDMSALSAGLRIDF